MAVIFKITEPVQQRICIKFHVKLEHSSKETFWMVQKTPALGTWRLAASSRQCARSCIRSHAEFLVQHQITQVAQPPYNPDLVPCDFWLFPKLKSPLKGKIFQTVSEIQENTMGQLMVTGRLCEVPRCLLWRGLRRHCSIYSVSCIFFSKCVYFSYYEVGYLLDRQYVCVYTYICICICMYVCICMSMCMYVYMYIDIYVYI